MICDRIRMVIERFWSAELGCPVESLGKPGAQVVVRREPGAFLLQYGEGYVWSVPARFIPVVERALGVHPALEEVFNAAAIGRIFGDATKLVLGPCPIAYCDGQMLRRRDQLPGCRRLTAGDRIAVESLAAACGHEAWEHGGVELEAHRAVYGCFVENQLVAAASYEVWGDCIAHVGVATAPSYRGRGFAKAVATAAATHALSEGLLPQWRTLASNLSSVRVGQELGFETVAAHFFVRLAAD